MNDRPTADELLAAVRDYLLSEVAPAAGDHRSRFRALIAGNVIAIVRRELATYDAGEDVRRELAEITALLGEPVAAGSAAADRRDQRAALAEANARLAGWIRAGGPEESGQVRAVRDVVRRQVQRKLEVANPRYLADFADGAPT